MTDKVDLLETRFRLNMDRISGLVRLLFSNDALKPNAAFEPSTGPRADILRAVVVFLHATFEVALRSYIPRPTRSLSFYSRSDLDKALRLSGIDPAPFRPLYPTLTQMAKRRKRIPHEADLAHDTPHEWGIADDWQLIMWLLAVSAFYYQFRISLGFGNAVERAMSERLRTAMASHVAFGKQLLAFPSVPRDLRVPALQEAVLTLEGIVTTLKLDPRAFTTNSR
jgi:hypothetical protein